VNAVADWINGVVERIPAAAATWAVSLVLLVGTGAVLALAMWLEPNPMGHSTHRQLGLSQCSFLAVTGYPCPMCGATTTFTLMAHLRPFTALLTQPFAALLFLMTVGVFGVSAAEVIAPRRRWQRMLTAIEPIEGLLAGAFLAFMGVAWLYKIWMMSAA
jgi:hypothetical protein